jgi:hypothetical protein
MVTTKVPPVAGCRATSPIEMEKVDRSSWAYYNAGKQFLSFYLAFRSHFVLEANVVTGRKCGVICREREEA